MIKIIFQIQDNKLFVQKKRKLNTDQKNLINTNVISQNELVFSDEYILTNLKLVQTFLKELIIDAHINTLIIKENSIAPLILQTIKNIDNLNNLYLLEEDILTYSIAKEIINTKCINFVSLYNIPTFLLEMLDKENITVNSRNEILFLSNFMEENNLENFSSLYYKTIIYLTLPLSKEDEEDFKSFININRYLKIIYINKLHKNDIENILDILEKNKIKNIKIIIEENINNIELIEYLKKLNKKNAKINNIQFKIDYSKDYLQDNLISQIHLNTIKTCIFISLFIVSSLVTYVFYSNYTSMQKVEKIQEDINNVLAEYQDNKDSEPKLPPNPPENPEEPIKEELVIRDEMQALLEINPDTVGWLKVNNTNVDYPVVQADDNDYYLKKNFKNQKDASGWIYMDYRANPEELSKNTIIFGHNMYYSGVMFGTLYKTKYANWYKKSENQIIEFDTLYEKLNWQIFSIYVVPNTNDYLIANFSSNEKFQEYLDMVTDRSIYEFNTPVSNKDKILTLSTCSGDSDRLVIHAVLLHD